MKSNNKFCIEDDPDDDDYIRLVQMMNNVPLDEVTNESVDESKSMESSEPVSIQLDHKQKRLTYMSITLGRDVTSAITLYGLRHNLRKSDTIRKFVFEALDEFEQIDFSRIKNSLPTETIKVYMSDEERKKINEFAIKKVCSEQLILRSALFHSLKEIKK